MEMNLRSRVDATLLELQREKQVNASLQQQIEDAEHRLLEAATTCSLRLDNEKLRALELRRKIRAAKEEELHTSLATMLEKDAKEAEEKCIEVFSEQSSMFLDHLKSVKRGDPLPSKVRIALRDVHNLEMRMEGAIKKLFTLRALRRKNIWTKSELELLSKHYVTAAKNYESKQSEADALSRHWNAEQQRREKAEGKVKPLKTRKMFFFEMSWVQRSSSCPFKWKQSMCGMKKIGTEPCAASCARTTYPWVVRPRRRREETFEGSQREIAPCDGFYRTRAC